MANEQVQKFRDTVDVVIQKQVDEARNVGWLGMDTTAESGELTFGSYPRSSSRPHPFSVAAVDGGGFPEHVWGVYFEGRQRVEGVQRAGLLAVVSTVDRPRSLLRHWCFGRALISIDTVRELDDPDIMAEINDYVRSPHLTSSEVIGKIAVLSSDELTTVQRRETELNKSEAELAEDLKAIDEYHRRSAEEARNIIIY